VIIIRAGASHGASHWSEEVGLPRAWLAISTLSANATRELSSMAVLVVVSLPRTPPVTLPRRILRGSEIPRTSPANSIAR